MTNSDTVGSRKPKHELNENIMKQRNITLGITISFQNESLLGVESAETHTKRVFGKVTSGPTCIFSQHKNEVDFYFLSYRYSKDNHNLYSKYPLYL